MYVGLKLCVLPRAPSLPLRLYNASMCERDRYPKQCATADAAYSTSGTSRREHYMLSLTHTQRKPRTSYIYQSLHSPLLNSSTIPLPSIHHVDIPPPHRLLPLHAHPLHPPRLSPFHTLLPLHILPARIRHGLLPQRAHRNLQLPTHAPNPAFDRH